MREAIAKLTTLRDTYLKQAESMEEEMETALADYIYRDQVNWLSFVAVGNALHVDYCGDPFDDPFQALLELLVSSDVADVLGSLTLRGPDDGANGTRNWDLTVLGTTTATFPQLRELTIEQNKPGNHNRSVVAADYDEDGVLGRLLSRAPRIESLITPSAPDESFFQVGHRPLRFMSVDAGYAHQDFIRHLAKSSSFPGLRCLEFGEFSETYLDDWQAEATSEADYELLFRSNAFKPVNRFVWRNPLCSKESINRFKALRPDIQLLVVRTAADYV